MLDLVKAQALRIAKLEHQLAGYNRHRFGSKSESIDQLQLKLEAEETAAGMKRQKPLPMLPTKNRRPSRSANLCHRNCPGSIMC